MRLPRHRKERSILTANVVIFIGMIIVAYQLFTYAKKVYQDYLIDQQIAAYREDIEKLGLENAEMEEMIQYLQTDAYREKVAKGVTAMKNPGEEVYVIKGDNPAAKLDAMAAASTKPLIELSNPEKWWAYFFGDRSRYPVSHAPRID